MEKAYKSNEIWCAPRGKDNHDEDWQKCRKCCPFCKEKQNCKLMSRPCRISKKHFCCWRVSPVEWVLGKLEPRAAKESYMKRRYELWIEKGRRAGDGTWEGSHLAEFRKRNRKEYKEILTKIKEEKK